MKNERGVVVLASLCPPESMVSSVKIARFIASQFKLPIMAWNGKQDAERAGGIVVNLDQTREEIDMKSLSSFDHLIFVNSSTTFSGVPYLEYLKELVLRAKCVVYIQNDYALPMHSRYTRAAREGEAKDVRYWSAIERVVNAKGGALLDWNRLTYEPEFAPSRAGRYESVFYHGACRTNRRPLFEHWFNSPQRVRTVISVPSGSQLKKFTELLGGSKPQLKLIHDSRRAVAQLHEHKAALYLEDPYSSRNYTCPANRFYEALSAGTAIAIDTHARQTFERAGLKVRDEWVVDGQSDLKGFFAQSYEHAKRQVREWHRDFVGELKRDLKKAAKEIGLS